MSSTKPVHSRAGFSVRCGYADTGLLERVSQPGHCAPTSTPPGLSRTHKEWLCPTRPQWQRAFGQADEPARRQPNDPPAPAAAGIAAPIGCHTFRAIEITVYLANGGALEHAQEMAAHESPRTTKLYDRTKERLTQDEVERIRL